MSWPAGTRVQTRYGLGEVIAASRTWDSIAEQQLVPVRLDRPAPFANAGERVVWLDPDELSPVLL